MDLLFWGLYFDIVSYNGAQAGFDFSACASQMLG
jgi:hypothetical protein